MNRQGDRQRDDRIARAVVEADGAIAAGLLRLARGD
jgi:hypothetical protein